MTTGEKVMCGVALGVALVLAASIYSSCSSGDVGSFTVSGSGRSEQGVGKSGLRTVPPVPKRSAGTSSRR
jgi:hypothetical protein